MKPKFQERGQALILIVFAAVVLFGFAALAIDGSRVFSDRRHAQNAADTAVLAAALAKIRTLPPADADAAAHDAGILRAASNGFDNNGTTNTVLVRSCAGATNPPCEGLPSGANEAEYIQVVIRLTTKTTFARVIGRPEVPSVVTAVARASGSSSTSSFLANAAIFSTKGGQNQRCFDVSGGGSVYTHGSGIYVNCEGDKAVFMNNNSTLNMDDRGQVVGCHDTNGGAPLTNVDCGANGGHSQTINGSTFASAPTTQPPPACGSPVSPPSGATVYSPGTYSNMTILGNVMLSPGVYCIQGSFNVLGTLTGTGGGVQIVLQDQNISMTSGAVIDFTDLEIYGRDASFLLTAGSAFRADRLRFFSTGTGSVQVNGGAELTSGNAYFYLYRGDLTWNGQSIINLHAPPQGDPYGGLLIHKPWENTVKLTLNGGSNINLTGTFLAPGSDVVYNGQVGFVLHSQIIGSTFSVNGGGNLDIYYDPTENYSPPNSPLIQLTK